MEQPNTGDAWSRFAGVLKRSSRILCLVGAGLSAPSGLATWRGTNGLWNDINLRELASSKKFQDDPITVWKFYGERMIKSLAARPNAAHYALAALATWNKGWLTINQNVDGLLEQTDHPSSRLLGIHGTLMAVRCTKCNYTLDVEKLHDIPFLLSLSNANDGSLSATLCDLPHCPECANLLRPGVVWFEAGIDLVIAAGTSLEVFPAAEWVEAARAFGATLAIIDVERDHRLANDLDDNDWFFEGDIAVILPRILNLLGR